MAQLRAELLTDVMSHVEATLCELGVDGLKADHCGHAIADMLAQHWGGQVISMPVDHAYKLSQRERQILDALKCCSKSEASMRFGITINGLNKLLRRAARRHVEDAQIDLFGAANEEAPQNGA